MPSRTGSPRVLGIYSLALTLVFTYWHIYIPDIINLVILTILIIILINLLIHILIILINLIILECTCHSSHIHLH